MSSKSRANKIARTAAEAEAEVELQNSNEPAAEPAEESAPEAPAASVRTIGKSKLAPEAIVSVLRAANPKSGNARGRFEGYYKASGDVWGGTCTVKGARDAGVTTGDLWYDIRHGHISVTLPGSDSPMVVAPDTKCSASLHDAWLKLTAQAEQDAPEDEGDAPETTPSDNSDNA